ncbi:SUKH-3 domain-containing protein [Klenkia marina]|uniref:SUKH-3 domain-containing protein n=1 Tax=Klenkia marina TaxID=1960309 RepID=UPI00140374E0|nr:SUKH-3 domain-containing protein [Klenkia marina]
MADGWLLWITNHRGEESVRGPGRRIHLFEHARVAQAHRWPNWPVDEIADRIGSAAPTDRFPPVAVAVLEDAGWFPGRVLPEAEITAWAAARVPDDDVRLHDAARRALVEFGGLRLHSEGVCDLEFFPHPTPDVRWREAASLAHWAGSVLFPVAEDRRQRVEGLVVVLEDGPGISGVVLAGEIDQYVVGRTVDEMIINYATGAPPQPVD